jgi:hypothetical protein
MRFDDSKVRRGKALLFVNKKKQKNFIDSGARALAKISPTGSVLRRKSFLVLFFKKEQLSFLR